VIDAIDANSPAAHSGLLVGDTILNFYNLDKLVTFVKKCEKIVEFEVTGKDNSFEESESSHVFKKAVSEEKSSESTEKSKSTEKNSNISEGKHSSSSSDIQMKVIQTPIVATITEKITEKCEKPKYFNEVTLKSSMKRKSLTIEQASEVSLPVSRVPTITKSQQQKVAFQLSKDVVTEVARKKSTRSVASSAFEDPEGKTISEIFKVNLKTVNLSQNHANQKNKTAKFTRKSTSDIQNKLLALRKMEENDKIVKNKNPKQAVGENDTISYKVPIIEDDMRSCLDVALDGEQVQVPKINKLLSRWQTLEVKDDYKNFATGSITGRTFQMKQNKSKRISYTIPTRKVNPKRDLVIVEKK